MSQERLENLLEHLSKLLDMPSEMKLDKDGMCSVRFQKKVETIVTICYKQELDQAWFLSELGCLMDSRIPDFTLDALERNLFWQSPAAATYAVDPATRVAILQAKQEIAFVSNEDFAKNFILFAKEAVSAKCRFQQKDDDAAELGELQPEDGFEPNSVILP